MSSILKRFKVLIADSDQHLANVCKTMLTAMGFSDVQITPSGAQALTMIKKGHFDFLITDWHLKEMDGITLLNRVRRDRDTPNRTMPIIMLTGRMEQVDVQTARDNGIHEYVVKPFSTKAIYNRLERIIEMPRCFVMHTSFVGPDRRNRQTQFPGNERRSKPMLPQAKPWDTSRSVGDPQMWLPDYTLKQKLGHNVTLDSLITPAVLAKAQASINAMAQESLQWIKADLASLKELSRELKTISEPLNMVNAISDTLLSISARSGTFGYTRASEVAYMLYLFFRNHFRADQVAHHVVIEKHVQVLQIIFGQNVDNDSPEMLKIVQELRNLSTKYTASEPA